MYGLLKHYILSFKTDTQFVWWFAWSALWKPQRGTVQTGNLTHSLKATKHNRQLWMSSWYNSFIYNTYINASQGIKLHQTCSPSWSEKKEKCTQEKQLMCGLLINIMTTWLNITWSWQWQSRNTEWQLTCYKKSPQRQKSHNLCRDMIPGKSCSPETSAPEHAAIN